MEKTIKKERFYAHSINKVWNAISDQEAISIWFIKADFKAEPGYEYTFTRDATTISGKVIEATPVHTLIYTWTVNGTETITTVKWYLKEENNGTLLTIEHTGIENYPEGMMQKMFDSFAGGWDSCIDELEKHLKKQYEKESI